MMSDGPADAESPVDAEREIVGEPACKAAGGAAGGAEEAVAGDTARCATKYLAAFPPRPFGVTFDFCHPGLSNSSTLAKSEESRRLGDGEVTAASAATVSRVGARHMPGLRAPATERRGGGMRSDQLREDRGSGTSSKSKEWRGIEESEGRLSLLAGDNNTKGLSPVAEIAIVGSPFPGSAGVAWCLLCKVWSKVPRTGVSSGTGVSSCVAAVQLEATAKSEHEFAHGPAS